MTALLDLTTRELQIVELVLAGYANKAIAATFLISEKTVEYHLANNNEKLRVRTRLLARIWALEQGLEARSRQVLD